MRFQVFFYSFFILLLASLSLYSSGTYSLKKINNQNGYKEELEKNVVINYSGRFISIFKEEKVGKIVFNPYSPSYKAPGTFLNLEDARFFAIRKARENAVLKLSEVISSLWFDSQNKFSELIERDNLFSRRISELLSEPVFLSTRVHLNKVRVELFLLLNGKNSLVDFIPVSYGTQAIPALNSLSAYDEYTSLLVDVRHLPYEPCLHPKIFREDGLQIYGPSFVSKNYAVEVGLAGYARNLKSAGKMPRAGTHPFYTLAENISGRRKCNIVLSEEDTDRILAAETSRKSLRHCQFIIIIK